MALKPWGGRFEGTTDKSVEDFTTSLSFDRRLARQDIAGSMAHARMLAQQGIITADEGEQIVAGLTEIYREIEAGEFEFDPALEDIHMAIESRLTYPARRGGQKAPHRPEPERPGGPGRAPLPGGGGGGPHP